MRTTTRLLLTATATVLALSACTTPASVGNLDPRAADPVLPLIVDGYVAYVEADGTLSPDAKADRKLAAEQLRAWWQAGMDAKAQAETAGEVGE